MTRLRQIWVSVQTSCWIINHLCLLVARTAPLSRHRAFLMGLLMTCTRRLSRVLWPRFILRLQLAHRRARLYQWLKARPSMS